MARNGFIKAASPRPRTAHSPGAFVSQAPPWPGQGPRFGATGSLFLSACSASDDAAGRICLESCDTPDCDTNGSLWGGVHSEEGFTQGLYQVEHEGIPSGVKLHAIPLRRAVEENPRRLRDIVDDHNRARSWGSSVGSRTTAGNLNLPMSGAGDASTSTLVTGWVPIGRNSSRNPVSWQAPPDEQPEQQPEKLEETPEMAAKYPMPKYVGQWLGAVRCGQGKITNPDGSWYEGNFADNKVHGHGKFVNGSGEVYEGEFEMGVFHGRGKFESLGGVYEGEWRQGEKAGHGVERWPDEHVYEGQHVNGRKHGEGMHFTGNKLSYKGQFRHDRIDGEGTYHFGDDRTYYGQWVDGVMQGMGVVEWPDGRNFAGTFVNGKPESGNAGFEPEKEIALARIKQAGIDQAKALESADARYSGTRMPPRMAADFDGATHMCTERRVS